MPRARQKTRCRYIYINHERQMIYVPVPKAAQRSMRYTLRRVGFTYKKAFRGRDVKLPEDYYKFTLIRNPYHRYVSAHTTARMRYVRARYVDLGKKKELKSEKQRDRTRIHREVFKNTEGVNNELWDLFVKSIEQNENKKRPNEHYAPQVHWLREKNLKPIRIDWYMILDHLESDLCRLEDLLGLELKRCHDHAAPQCWKDLLFGRLEKHPEYQARINALYKEDWELYNKWKK